MPISAAQRGLCLRAIFLNLNMRIGTKLLQNYRVDADTDRLMISVAAQLPGMQAFAYRLVYDRLPPGADAVRR